MKRKFCAGRIRDIHNVPLCGRQHDETPVFGATFHLYQVRLVCVVECSPVRAFYRPIEIDRNDCISCRPRIVFVHFVSTHVRGFLHYIPFYRPQVLVDVLQLPNGIQTAISGQINMNRNNTSVRSYYCVSWPE